jgi:hypothetical protein
MPQPVRNRTNHQGPHPDLKDCNAMRLTRMAVMPNNAKSPEASQALN